jgi:hypothetical protein
MGMFVAGEELNHMNGVVVFNSLKAIGAQDWHLMVSEKMQVCGNRKHLYQLLCRLEQLLP